jgi:hypothetical protein
MQFDEGLADGAHTRRRPGRECYQLWIMVSECASFRLGREHPSVFDHTSNATTRRGYVPSSKYSRRVRIASTGLGGLLALWGLPMAFGRAALTLRPVQT